MSYYEAKFQRERKDKPSDWVITPIFKDGKPSDRYHLQHLRS